LLILSPEERATLWHRAAITSDQEEREHLLERVATSALEESLRSKFDLYGDIGDRFVDSILVLAAADRLLDNDMLRRFQAIAIDDRGGDRFFAAVIARLGEVTEDSTAPADLRARARDHAEYWRDHAPALTEELFSVEEVARHFFVSKAAVYRWIKSGKLAAKKTPGGTIMGVYASELASSGPTKELTHLAVTEATAASSRVIASASAPAYRDVLADISAGRTKKVPRRRFDEARAHALDEAERRAVIQGFPGGYETRYPDGFVRRPGFNAKSGR
jgi:excisionase family DNA binding protein